MIRSDPTYQSLLASMYALQEAATALYNQNPENNALSGIAAGASQAIAELGEFLTCQWTVPILTLHITSKEALGLTTQPTGQKIADSFRLVIKILRLVPTEPSTEYADPLQNALQNLFSALETAAQSVQGIVNDPGTFKLFVA